VSSQAEDAQGHLPYELTDDSDVRLLLGGPSLDLHEAAAEGDAAEVAQLLAAGVPVDGRDPVGRTPLLCAAEEGEAACCAALLAAGADVRAVDREGFSALHHAAAARAPAAVRALLAAARTWRRSRARRRARAGRARARRRLPRRCTWL
jgi:hypothetical protein